MTTKKSQHKILFDNVTEFAQDFEEFCKAKGLNLLFTFSETKDIFAEHISRFLENNLCRYMEPNGYKYLHKLSHLATFLNR